MKVDFDSEKFYGFWSRVIVLIFLINSALAVVTCVDVYYKIGRGELVFAENTGDSFMHLPRLEKARLEVVESSVPG
jgi:hypothetical protein